MCWFDPALRVMLESHIGKVGAGESRNEGKMIKLADVLRSIVIEANPALSGAKTDALVLKYLEVAHGSK